MTAQAGLHDHIIKRKPTMAGHEKAENVTILYAGQISRLGYDKITTQCKAAGLKYQKATLMLFTTGGDPHAGFRIARALQCYFECGFDVLIPDICKSAGTLIAIGATSLVMSDRGELGPLDVQVIKTDELFERSSGLDLPQSIDALQAQVIESFRKSIIDIRMGGRLSTRIAGEIATNLTTGVFAPIFAQIDPIRLGEMQRANYIGMEYGQRLASKSRNLKHGGLEKLVAGYPSHGFVIDRKEARELFANVRSLTEDEERTVEGMRSLLSLLADSEEPEVLVLGGGGQDEKGDGSDGQGIEGLPTVEGAVAGAEAGGAETSGNGQDVGENEGDH